MTDRSIKYIQARIEIAKLISESRHRIAKIQKEVLLSKWYITRIKRDYDR